MALKSLLILSLQACLFQAALCNAGYGPSLGINSGAGQIGQLSNGIGIGGPIGPNPALGPGPLGPAGPSYGYNNLVAGPGPIGHGPSSNSPFSGYGGSGSGDVAVTGELPVAGSTIVAGQVPIIGGVQFGGSIPAVGTVTITGTCSCGSPYGY